MYNLQNKSPKNYTLMINSHYFNKICVKVWKELMKFYRNFNARMVVPKFLPKFSWKQKAQLYIGLLDTVDLQLCWRIKKHQNHKTADL